MGSFTASTVAHDIKRSPGDLLAIKMGITKIWKGDNVLIKTDGYAYSAYATGAGGDQFVGVAAETVDNRYQTEGDSSSAAAAAGDRSCQCWQNGIVDRDIATCAIETDLGLPVYQAIGGGTDHPRMVIVADPGDAPLVGKIVGIISSTKVRVVIQAWGTVV
jgi:hypothetical protein